MALSRSKLAAARSSSASSRSYKRGRALVYRGVALLDDRVVVEVRAGQRVVTGLQRGVALALERVVVVGRRPWRPRGPGARRRARRRADARWTARAASGGAQGGQLVGAGSVVVRSRVGGRSRGWWTAAWRGGVGGAGPRRAGSGPSEAAGSLPPWPGRRGMGRSTARLGATASSAAVSSSGGPSQGKAAIHSSPSSAAHGLCSSRASIRRCPSPACTTSTGLTKRCPRSPYQRPVTSRRSPAAHSKRSTSKATPSETTSEAGICCRATGTCR